MYRNADDMTEELMRDATEQAVENMSRVVHQAKKPRTRADFPNSKVFTDAFIEKQNAKEKMLASDILNDTRKAERLLKCLCKGCFYRAPRVSGAAVTSVHCMCCGVDMHFSNTSTDRLCLECATDNSLCTHCGGDLDMNRNRASWPSPKKKD